jgi:hypothetical protein
LLLLLLRAGLQYLLLLLLLLHWLERLLLLLSCRLWDVQVSRCKRHGMLDSATTASAVVINTNYAAWHRPCQSHKQRRIQLSFQTKSAEQKQ